MTRAVFLAAASVSESNLTDLSGLHHTSVFHNSQRPFAKVLARAGNGCGGLPANTVLPFMRAATAADFIEASSQYLLGFLFALVDSRDGEGGDPFQCLSGVP